MKIKDIRKLLEGLDGPLFNGTPRDPKRIPDILRQLKEIWEKYPDLRLSQLIGNLQTRDGDLYNVEDQQLIDRLRDLYNDRKA